MRATPPLAACLLLVWGVAAPGCTDEPEGLRVVLAPTRPDGARLEATVDPFELRILDAGGKVVLRTTTGGDRTGYGTPGATRDDGPDNVKVIPGWDGYTPDEKPWEHARSARLVRQEAHAASFELDTHGGTVAIDASVDGAKVTLDVHARPNGTSGWNKTTVAFGLRDDEHFFGLGERYASVDHRGSSLYAWSEEGGTSRGEGFGPDPTNPGPNGPSMTYFPVPFMLSSAGYALHLATTYRTEMHLGSERPDAWRFAANARDVRAVVYVHDDPLQSLDDFTRDTGRPFVPASWVFGPRRRISLGDRVGGVEEWRLLRDKHVPTTGLDDNVHFLPARSELGREADLRAWTGSLHAAGFKVMAYNNPHVSTSIDRAKADLEDGKARGLLVKTPEGAVAETFFISGEPQSLATIDLTIPAGVAWFQELLRRTLALGYDGWMHDFGEYVRRPWRFGDGRDGEAVHNEFPVLSAKAAHDLLTAEKPDDFLFFVRAGYTGTQAFVPAVWSGDPEVSFDDTQGMPAMLRGGINLGLSGVPLWGSDLTGFKCLTDAARDKELYLRWAEVGAVSPIMMEQNACANPLGRREKWKLWNDEETIAVYGAMARLHTRLAPYFEVLARQAHATGIPIMRHPFLLHPREPEAWKTQSTFYLGPSLWAAPVVERGATTKTTWLPPGRWVDVDDRTTYDGGKAVTIPAPLAKLPLLLKDGGIVPLLDASVETLAPATDANVVTRASVDDRLDVLVALSPGTSARIVLADGTDLSARREAGATASDLPRVEPSGVASCTDGCWSTVGEERLLLTTPRVASGRYVEGDVVVEARGPSARRVRWDVTRFR